jgi:hypothetical protein
MSTKLYVGNLPYEISMAPRGSGDGHGSGRQRRESRW